MPSEQEGMLRTRYLKPGFFENEDLAALPASTRLLFAGLWLIADKQGRLRDRPARIKGELFPYDNTNVERGLKQLADAGFVVRYEADGQRLIWIPTWSRHQHPHPHEPESTLPRHEHDQCQDDVITKSGSDPSRTGTGTINSYSYANADEEEDRNESAATPSGAPSSGFASSSWDFLRALYLQNVGNLPASDGSTLRGYLSRGMPDDWMAAAINETATCDKPGMGYLLKILKRCEETNTPPSSLKKTRTG
jgi:hypothetical protein